MTSKQFDVEQRSRQSAADTGRNGLLAVVPAGGGRGGPSVGLGKPWWMPSTSSSRAVSVTQGGRGRTPPTDCPAMPLADAAAELAQEARGRTARIHPVTAIVEAAGQRAPRLERPAGLTEREAQVIAMLARGRQTKQVARALGSSPKTADRHVQSAYRKVGVSTRAAATLFAMEHSLVSWGELPMAQPGGRS